METMQIIPIDRHWSVEPAARGQLDRFLAEIDLGALVLEARAARQPDNPMSAVDSVGVINIRGTITKHPSLFHSLFGGNTSTLMIGEALRIAVADESIKSIMLRVDSPGGSVEGVADLADQVFQARAVKPIIAQIDGIDASAAYWITSQATRIFMGQTDQVGSIGIMASFLDFSEKFAKEGVKAVTISTGKFKAAGDEGTKITAEHREYFQGLADTYFKSFAGAVRRGRTMSDTMFNAVAEGKLYIGQDGVDSGLVDGIQSTSTTLGQMLDPKILARMNETAAVGRKREMDMQVTAAESLTEPVPEDKVE